LALFQKPFNERQTQHDTKLQCSTFVRGFKCSTTVEKVDVVEEEEEEEEQE